MVIGCLAFNGYAEQSKERITNSLGMEFVLIKPGKFMMGSPEDEPGRFTGERLHAVNLTNPFYMQTTEVTQEQWKALMGKNPASHKRCGDTCPVEQVSWEDVLQPRQSVLGLSHRLEHASLDFGHDLPDLVVDLQRPLEPIFLFDLHEPQAVHSHVAAPKIASDLPTGQGQHCSLLLV